MLEGLDSIDWGQYTHAYGPATDVPEMIRAFLLDEVMDDDTIHTESAIQISAGSLFSTIWHQGTVYPATVVAIPFLIELLTHPTLTSKANVLNLLWCCNTGNGYLLVHAHSGYVHVDKDSVELEVALEQERQTVKAVKKAVNDGIPVYLDLLHDADVVVRQRVAEVLATCVDQTARIADALIARINVESELDAPETGLHTLIYSLGQVLTVQQGKTVDGILSVADHTRFNRWLMDSTFPVLGRVMASCFVLEHGDEAERNRALEFIFQLPHTTQTSLAPVMGELFQALIGYDVAQALQWLTQMADYPDAETVGYLPDHIGHLYHRDPVQAEPILNVLERLLRHEDSKVRCYSAMNLAMFTLSDPERSVKPLLEQALAHEQDTENRALMRRLLKNLHRTPPEMPD